jgi:hypothetical protein
MVGDNGELRSRLMEIPAPQHALAAPAIVMDQLAEKFSQLSISDSTQISEASKQFDSGSATINSESNPGSMPEVSGPFPLGLRSTALIYQDLLQEQLTQHRRSP